MSVHHHINLLMIQLLFVIVDQQNLRIEALENELMLVQTDLAVANYRLDAMSKVNSVEAVDPTDTNAVDQTQMNMNDEVDVEEVKGDEVTENAVNQGHVDETKDHQDQNDGEDYLINWKELIDAASGEEVDDKLSPIKEECEDEEQDQDEHKEQSVVVASDQETSTRLNRKRKCSAIGLQTPDTIGSKKRRIGSASSGSSSGCASAPRRSRRLASKKTKTRRQSTIAIKEEPLW